jgi:hypothetical protein
VPSPIPFSQQNEHSHSSSEGLDKGSSILDLVVDFVSFVYGALVKDVFGEVSEQLVNTKTDIIKSDKYFIMI